MPVYLRTLLKCIVFITTGSVQAVPVFQPTGSSLTYGAVSQHQTILSATNNPAGAATMLEVDEGWFGMGVVSSVGVGYEAGPVDDLAEQVKDLRSKITGDLTTLDQANEVITDFKVLINQLGNDAYLSLQAVAHGPLFPMIFTSWKTLKGSLAFDSNIGVKAQFSILEAPIDFNIDTLKIETKSAAYLKTAAVSETSVAYSRPLYQSRTGSLYAGVKANYYVTTLRKALIGLAVMDNAEQLIRDELKDIKNDPQFQTGIGVDLGIIWVSKHYRVGAAFKNLNAPKFNYPSIGIDCSKKFGVSRDNCNIAAAHADKIDLGETYVMNRQMTVEGALYTWSRNFFLATAVDIRPVNDPLGNQFQWMSLSTGYATSSWWIPGIRLGYRANIAGTQLHYVTGGMTMFKMFTMDFAYGLKTGTVKGVKVPRSGMLNLGFELLF